MKCELHRNLIFNAALCYNDEVVPRLIAMTDTPFNLEREQEHFRQAVRYGMRALPLSPRLNIIVPLGVSGSGKNLVSSYLTENYGAAEYTPIRPIKEIIEQTHNLEPFALETQEGKSMKPHPLAVTNPAASFSCRLKALMYDAYPELIGTRALEDYVNAWGEPHQFPTYIDYLINCFHVTTMYQGRLRRCGADEPVWITARWLKAILEDSNYGHGTVVLPGIRHPEEAKVIIDLARPGGGKANVVVLDIEGRGKPATSDTHLSVIRDMFRYVDAKVTYRTIDNSGSISALYDTVDKVIEDYIIT